MKYRTEERRCKRDVAALASVLILIPAAVLFFSSAKLHYPSAQWDGWALDAAQAIRSGTFADKPYVIHPSLYLYLLAAFQFLFPGVPLVQGRLLNFIFYVFTGWLVFFLSGRLADSGRRTRAGLIGAALYFTSPLAAQGIFLLDLGDTGPVPAAAAAYFYVLSCGGAARFAALSAVFALNLWTKLIHSFFLALASLAASFRDRVPRRDLLALAAGTVLFLVTWAIYSHGAQLSSPYRWGPIEYLVKEMLFNYQRIDMGAGAASFISARAATLARVLLWMWPILLLWGWRLRERGLGTGPERTMNLFIAIFLVGAWASKGTSNGFPKYHAVLVPPLCALCGSFISGEYAGLRAAFRPALWSCAAAASLLFYLAGDPIYAFEHGLREALIAGAGLRAALLKLGLQGGAAAVSAGLFMAWGLRRMKAAPLLPLAFCVFAWNTAMLGLQAGGNYFTNYGYGTSGKDRVLRYVGNELEGGTVSGPNEFAWDFKAAGVPFRELSDACFINKECALGVMRDPGTSFFIFGQASNTVEQVGYFLSLGRESLGRPFKAVKEGDFWVYDLGAPYAAGRREGGKR